MSTVYIVIMPDHEEMRITSIRYSVRTATLFTLMTMTISYNETNELLGMFAFVLLLLGFILFGVRSLNFFNFFIYEDGFLLLVYVYSFNQCAWL